jgi:hypothetical protein
MNAHAWSPWLPVHNEPGAGSTSLTPLLNNWRLAETLIIQQNNMTSPKAPGEMEWLNEGGWIEEWDVRVRRHRGVVAAEEEGNQRIAVSFFFFSLTQALKGSDWRFILLVRSESLERPCSSSNLYITIHLFIFISILHTVLYIYLILFYMNPVLLLLLSLLSILAKSLLFTFCLLFIVS